MTSIRTNRPWLPLSVAFFLSLGWQLAPAAARAETAPPVKELIATFKKVTAPAEGAKMTEADRKANAPVYKKLDGFFAFEAFGDSCLGAARSKLSDKQAVEYRNRLIDIMRRQGYANAGTLFKDGELKYEPVRNQDGKTVTPLKLHFAKQDIDMVIEFVWDKSNRIVDLIMDDDSLSKDFGNQIGRVLKNGGVEALGKKLADKQAELDKEGL